MKIRLLSRQQIDPKKWNDLILECHDPEIYAQSWYWDAVTDSRWSALVSGDYDAVMPLYIKKMWGLPYITQPFLCQYTDIYSKEIPDEKQIRSFLNNVPKRVLKTAFNFNNALPDGIMRQYHVTKRHNQTLSLSLPYVELKKAYNRSTIRNIRKSAEAAVEIQYCDNPDDAYNFIRKYDETGWMNFHKDAGHHLIKAANTHTRVIGQTTSLNGVMVGAGIFIYFGKKIYWLMSAINDTGRQNSIMYRMLDDFIQFHAKSDYTLDFCGSSIPNVAQRNLGFGAVTNDYCLLKRKWFTIFT